MPSAQQPPPRWPARSPATRHNPVLGISGRLVPDGGRHEGRRASPQGRDRRGLVHDELALRARTASEHLGARADPQRRVPGHAQAQIRGAEPSASPARARYASRAQRRTPPRHHLCRGRSIVPRRARAASPRRAASHCGRSPRSARRGGGFCAYLITAPAPLPGTMRMSWVVSNA
jgi:hypothetical protein